MRRSISLRAECVCAEHEVVVGIDVKGSDFLVIGPRPGEVDPIPIGHHDIEDAGAELKPGAVPAEQGKIEGSPNAGCRTDRPTARTSAT